MVGRKGHWFLFIFLSLSFLILSRLRAQAVEAYQSTKSFVSVRVLAVPETVRIGEQFELHLFFHPGEGIHVNANPPVELKLLTPGVSVKRLSNKGKDTMTYIPLDKPVRFRTKLPHSMHGTVSLKGAVRYFVCSDAEGWCTRVKEPFEVTIFVR